MQTESLYNQVLRIIIIMLALLQIQSTSYIATNSHETVVVSYITLCMHDAMSKIMLQEYFYAGCNS